MRLAMTCRLRKMSHKYGGNRDRVRRNLLHQLRSNRRLFSVGPGLLLLVAAVCFAPVLDGYWLADDFTWVQEFIQYDWRRLGPLFLGEWSRTVAQEYRPLWAVSFALDLHVWGAQPLPLHLTNILWHLIASALVWYLVIRMAGPHRALAGLLALAVFILAPMHVEPVAWISARGHILAPIFILAAFILFILFKQRGQLGYYVASLGAAIAAFMTQEIAVALPFLLLAYDLLDHPKPSWKWLSRRVLRQIPFAVILAVYLLFRIFIFGQLGRDTTPSSVSTELQTTYVAVRTLWLSFTPSISAANASSESIKLMFVLLISGLLITPLWFLPKGQRGDYARKCAYFAVIWPTIATAVLMGANSQRHFYLASVGPAIALGLAGARLLHTGRIPMILAAGALALLLVTNGFALASGVQAFRLNGERSWQLRYEADQALERAAQDPASTVVIIPEVPDTQGILWDYFYPVALQPPFTTPIPVTNVIASFASCHCSPEEWTATHAAALQHLIHNEVGPVYVVDWDEHRSTFATRTLSQYEFLHNGYVLPGGSVLRPSYPGLPSPRLQ